MVFAFIGVSVIAPFALCLALILSIHCENKKRKDQVQQVAANWQTYLDDFDQRNRQMVEKYGNALLHDSNAHFVSYSRFDDDHFGTQQ